MSTEYKIQQVVYVISNKQQQIIPVQIVEKNVKSTVQGEEILYKVIAPNDENKSFELNSVDGEIYTSLEKVRAVLQKKVTDQINMIVNQASQIASEIFNVDEIANLSLLPKQGKKRGRPPNNSQLKNKPEAEIVDNPSDMTDESGKVVAKIKSVTWGDEQEG